MKEKCFGIKIKMAGITRKIASEIAAAYFGTSINFDGTYYNTYSVRWTARATSGKSSTLAQKNPADRLLWLPMIIKQRW